MGDFNALPKVVFRFRSHPATTMASPKRQFAFCSSAPGRSLRVGVSLVASLPGAFCTRSSALPVFASRRNLRSFSSWRPPPTCSTAESAPRSSFRVGAISVLLFVNAMLWALVIYPAMVVVAAFGKLTRRPVQNALITLMQVWMRLTIRSSFLRVRVVNAEQLPSSSRVLYVCNHQSALDVFVTAFLLRRVRYLMPARAFRVPLIGWMMSLAGWVPVDGTDRRGQMDALRRAGEALQDSSLVVFPEGVPNAGGVLKEFPSAVFRAAQKAGVIVAPITIHGTGSMSDGKLGVPSRRPSEKITVSVHEPIEDVSLDVKEIARLAFIAVRSALPQRLWGN